MKRPERDRVAGSNSIGRGEHAAKRRSSIRGRKSSRSTMTREATARFRLGSIPARSLSPRGIPGGGGLLLAPGRLSVGRGVGWGGGAERRVTRPFVNNLVKVANHSGYSSLGRCLSKALLESGKKLTGRLPVTLMCLPIMCHVISNCCHLHDASSWPRRRFSWKRLWTEGGGKGFPVCKKDEHDFSFSDGFEEWLHKSFEFFRREIFVLEFDEEKYHLNSTKKV